MNYHFKLHKQENGFWAECLEISSCSTQGDTLEELVSNAHEALNLHLDEPDNSKLIFPLPNKRVKKDKNIISVKVGPGIAFAFLMRRTRLKRGFTQNQMKTVLKFQTLFSYQKLEKSEYANPTLKSMEHIKNYLPDFPFQYLF